MQSRSRHLYQLYLFFHFTSPNNKLYRQQLTKMSPGDKEKESFKGKAIKPPGKSSPTLLDLPQMMSTPPWAGRSTADLTRGLKRYEPRKLTQDSNPLRRTVFHWSASRTTDTDFIPFIIQIDWWKLSTLTPIRNISILWRLTWLLSGKEDIFSALRQCYSFTRKCRARNSKRGCAKPFTEAFCYSESTR